MNTYDVVILGGGLSGAFLARQLKLARPAISVRVLEAAPEIADLKVGESTVEVAAHYMSRHLDLSGYLYRRQLPKNGLRFFFDNAEKSLPLTAMSEIGSDHLPFHPSFQLERARLESDLCEMNRALGIEVSLGAKVTDVEIRTEKDLESRHVVTIESDGQTEQVSARWVCDATGRRQLLSRKLGKPIHKEHRLPTAGVWARFRGAADFDRIGDDAWRKRVRYTSRHLSTNHFMYKGYWIWFIPLAGDLMSVGVVYDREVVPSGPKTRQDMVAFLRSHRAVSDLLSDAEMLDFGSFANLPYYADTYFSEDRWALTGEAGAFTDPFYSPGSDFIATANLFIGDLIFRDLDASAAEATADSSDWRERAELYSRYFTLKYESVIRLYAGLYRTFGSYDVFRLKYLLDFHNYYNLVVWPFMAEKLTDRSWLTAELRLADRILQGLDVMATQFQRLSDERTRCGSYFCNNQGQWANGLNGVVGLEPVLGTEFDAVRRRDEADRVFGSVYAALREELDGVPGLSRRDRVLRELNFPTICSLGAGDDALNRLCDRVARKLTKELRQEFPDAGALMVSLDPRKPGDEGLVIQSDGAPGAPEVIERARQLWNAHGASPVHDVL